MDTPWTTKFTRSTPPDKHHTFAANKPLGHLSERSTADHDDALGNSITSVNAEFRHTEENQ
ncbi:MAG: hypothetical protein QG597_1504 [Actinomycetota bacterium]|nr:hypothetical protein [Actinomycetota bacterium]